MAGGRPPGRGVRQALPCQRLEVDGERSRVEVGAEEGTLLPLPVDHDQGVGVTDARRRRRAGRGGGRGKRRAGDRGGGETAGDVVVEDAVGGVLELEDGVGVGVLGAAAELDRREADRGEKKQRENRARIEAVGNRRSSHAAPRPPYSVRCASSSILACGPLRPTPPRAILRRHPRSPHRRLAPPRLCPWSSHPHRCHRRATVEPPWINPPPTNVLRFSLDYIKQ